MKKHFTAPVIFAATALASQQAWALGFGRPVSDAVLGQSFTFTVPVHVEPGERFAGDCLAAKVYFGDALLPPNVVRTDVLPGATDDTLTLRIITSTPVSEPIVEVAVEIACDRHFSRRFSVFADPPTLAAGPALVAPLPQAGAPVPRQVAPAAAPASTAYSAAYAAQRAASGPAGARPRVLRKGATMALANDINTPAAARRPATDNGSAKKGPRAAPAPAATSRLLLDPGAPHLQLDMEEPVIPAASASGAAPGLAALEDDDLRQLKALQQSLDNARRDSQAQHDQAARLQAELAQAKAQPDTGGNWTPWLLALLAVAAAAIAGLVWKLRQQTRIAHSDWFNQSALGPATAVPPAAELPPERPAAVPVYDVTEEPTVAVPRMPFQEPVADLPHADDGDARGVPHVDQSATRPLDRHSLAAVAPANAPRELSVEELLDLEQQADFFIALGQEDAAVDLLMSHLRSAGGQSPLPYTKLLEIYRRQGDRSAYERTRARFNRRFNAYAPDWDTGPTAGRLLEDYPDTIAQLERAWHSPLDAMAILESLLFKRDDTSELFDLPAYRDVLVLYSLARDLWQHGGGQGGA
ncbi:MAG: hypothetical protein JF585_00295, partial [Burkholderiales bacterium]|nr:hypothetical protein [Burkholderiales bacterium]